MKKVTSKNIEKVLDNFKKFILESNKENQKLLCEDFNNFLNELKDNDCFGTEGPRGDNRN